MKLYIKEKVLTLKPNFTIKDELENDKYYVEGEMLTIGRKLHVRDLNQREVAFIKEKVLSLFGEYEVYVGEELISTIKGKFGMLRKKLHIEDLDWHITGDITSHQYVVLDNMDNEIVSVSKAWFTWGDSYEINIRDSRNEILAIAIVLAIDSVLAKQDNNY